MARVIEDRIIQRINTWKEGSYKLSERDKVRIEGNIATYYLWDYNVFSVEKKDNKRIISFCFHGWGSQTTKNRISELLWYFADKVYIFRKNWIHYLKMNDNYYEIKETSFYKIEDGKLLDKDGREIKALEDFKR